MADFRWDNDIAVDVQHGYLDRGVTARGHLGPQLVTNTDDRTMLRALREELKRASSFLFSVAFVSPSAISLLKQELVDFPGAGTIVTSDYLGFNSPHAFRELLNLRHLGIDVRLHSSTAFHPKGYVFSHDGHVTAILGSSNLTARALVDNHEWNLRVSGNTGSSLDAQLEELTVEQLRDSVPLTEEWISTYELTYVAPVSRPRTSRIVGDDDRMPDPDRALSTIAPNSMQLEALSHIDAVRQRGADRALVISATGTGKTILSALDVRAVDPDRMLFIVHREQILDRAMSEFQRVLGVDSADLGKVAGGTQQLDRRYVFATVQSLAREATLASIDATAFEYVLIDEAHRAGSESYQRILAHLRPSFLLGMTATPERTDGYDLYGLFDYNVAYEIRLNRALEAGMLTPFRYFGVSDFTTDEGVTTDDFTDLSLLVSRARVDHIIEAIQTYGHSGIRVRGLMFCRNKAEARLLSDALNAREINGKTLRTVALTGEDSIERREEIVRRLESGELDYILTVDIFNEGIDIPSVNQVVMLRQTQSAIVFVQQLGRGLRIAAEKEYLVVIDFIGNYANNYLIPIAMFGDNSLNKESLRKKLISVEEKGVMAGLSSIRFDRIAQDRVLSSIVETKLDSISHLKAAIEALRFRLGRIPLLMDFMEADAADPILLALKLHNYPALIEKTLKHSSGLSDDALRLLTFLSAEVLAAKRDAEARVLERLLAQGALTRDELLAELSDLSEATLDSAVRVLSGGFSIEQEQTKYRQFPVEVSTRIALADWFRTMLLAEPRLRAEIDDIVVTACAIAAQRYAGATPFLPAAQYSRKDASRLLNWQRNLQNAIFGYKIDALTSTAVVFVTLHSKDPDAPSARYEDELLDTETMRWLISRSHTLTSAKVAPIVANDVAVHVFVQKDDAHKGDFYYLGRATATDAHQKDVIAEDGVLRGVGEMLLRFNQPIETGLFDYFQPVLTV